MKDETPARATSADPQQEPHLDTSGDTDEPAFSWLSPAKPAGNKNSAGTPAAGTPVAGTPVGGTPVGGTPAAGTPAAGTAAAAAAAAPGAQPDRSSGRPDAKDTPSGKTGATPADRSAGTANAVSGAQATQGAPTQPESRAGRKAAAAAVDSAAEPASRGSSPVFKEPLPTSALQVRPPDEDVERRNAQRESAANAKPVLPRVMQVLLAVFFPITLLILAVRAVTSPLFLWVEYNRPGFPGDGYGFNTDDRMTYGSYAVDYLSNWSGPRYLGDLMHRSGDKLFKDGEVSHMADVKVVILSTFGAGVLLLVLALVAILYLRKRSPGGVRRALFAGSIATLVLILGLGTLAALGWQQFFTEFHRIFFAAGTWTFSLDDTLIRLFPGQFWIDAGMVIGALVLLASVLTLVLTWPTRRRRGLAAKGPKATADQA